MRHLQHQFQVCHMTVFRALRKYGYHTSYNHNAAFYTLTGVPQFDVWGLWAYRDVRFSRWGTLPETLVTLVQQAPAGLTTRELEERLQTTVANLLARLVQQGRVQRRALTGHRVVYLAAAAEAGRQQWEQRQQQLSAGAAKAAAGLPPGCPAPVVIAVLRQMILAPEESPEQGARRIEAEGLPVTARQVRQVREHYALEKKRQG
jgi:DNA-binding MarR family transcriptional regulator